MAGHWVVKKQRRPWVEVVVYSAVGYTVVLGFLLFLVWVSNPMGY
jgi:hypothetical protein